ncbi:MAG: hypothetical protein AAGD22_17625 [Verrucomicrobiota bacterium]
MAGRIERVGFPIMKFLVWETESDLSVMRLYCRARAAKIVV